MAANVQAGAGANGAEEASARGTAEMVGPRIRAARVRRGHTLEDVAERAGLNKAFLSRVERGLKSPSLSTLLRIAAALEVEIGTLLGQTIDPDAIAVVRREDRRQIAPSDGFRAAASVFAPAGSGGMTAFVVEPDAEPSAETAGHPGEEIVIVLDGAIEMIFRDRTIELEAGDACRFEGHLGHRMRRVGAGRAEVLVVVAPEGGRGSGAAGGAVDIADPVA